MTRAARSNSLPARWRSLAAALTLALTCVVALVPPVHASHGSTVPASADERTMVLEYVLADPRMAERIQAIPDGELIIEVWRSPRQTNWAVDVYQGSEPVLWIYLNGDPLQIVQVRDGGFDDVAASAPGREGDERVGGELAGGPELLGAVTAVGLLLLGAAVALIGTSMSARRRVWILGPAIGLAVATWSVPTTPWVAAGWRNALFALGVLITTAILVGSSVGRRPPENESSAGPSVPARATTIVLAVAAVLLLCRAVVAAVWSFPVDIGLASATGGTMIADGEYVYGSAGFLALPGGDTYGPLTYLVYAVPQWYAGTVGTSITLETLAVGVAVVADLAIGLLLFLVARSWAGQAAGAIALLAWASMPAAWWGTITAVNDLLVGCAVLGCVALYRRPLIAGALGGAAGLLKLAPIVVLGVLADVRRHPARMLRVAIGAGGIIVLVGSYVWLRGTDGVERFWSATLGFQLDRADETAFWPSVDAAWLHPTAIVVVMGGAVLLGMQRSDTQIGVVAAAAATMAATGLLAASWLPNLLLWSAPTVALWIALAATSAPGLSTAPPPDSGQTEGQHAPAPPPT